jgi:hypothetical protein
MESRAKFRGKLPSPLRPHRVTETYKIPLIVGLQSGRPYVVSPVVLFAPTFPKLKYDPFVPAFPKLNTIPLRLPFPS